MDGDVRDSGRKLGVLDYLDRETVRAYDEALRKIRDPEISRNLQEFREAHVRHADELDEVAERMGWRREAASKGFHAFFEEHLGVIRDAKNEEEALEGLLLIEQANLGECRRTLSMGPPLGAADIIRQMCNDEVRDVDFIARHVMQNTGISQVAHETTAPQGAWDMSDEELVIMLSGLRFMNDQTAQAYDSAIGKAETDEVSGQLQLFAQEHRGHVTQIDELMLSLGKSVQLATGELQQYLHEAVALVGRAQSQDDALERLLLLERANAAEYESIIRANISQDDALQLLEKHHLDEQHHVLWVERHTPVGATYGMSSAPGLGENPTSTPGL